MKILRNVNALEHKKWAIRFYNNLSKSHGITSYYTNSPAKDYFHWNLWEKRKNVIDKIFSKHKISIICDLGSGEAPYLVATSPACYKIVIDLSSAALRKIKKLTDVEAIVADAEELPLRNLSADFSTSTELLEHLPNPYKAFKEQARITRKFMLVSTPRRSLPRVVIDRIIPKFPLAQRMQHICEITYKDMHDWAKKNGFSIEEEIYDNYSPNEMINLLRLPLKLVKVLDRMMQQVPFINKRCSILQMFVLKRYLAHT